jgi:hypothetical protein
MTGINIEPEPVFENDDEMLEVWERHRDDILSLRGEPGFMSYSPGTRPWAWWKYDAPGPRRILGYHSTHLGEIPRLESTIDYLKRHHLLFPGEEEQYTAMWAEYENLPRRNHDTSTES